MNLSFVKRIARKYQSVERRVGGEEVILPLFPKIRIKNVTCSRFETTPNSLSRQFAELRDLFIRTRRLIKDIKPYNITTSGFNAMQKQSPRGILYKMCS